MRRILLSILVFMLLIGCIYILHPRLNTTSKSALVTNTLSQLDCTTKNLTASLSSEGAAGSTYLTAKLTNKSDTQCALHGNLYTNLHYDTSVTNLTIVHNTPEPSPFLVIPAHGKATAIIHYNNGPQCSSDVRQVATQFIYTLSNTERAIFIDKSGRNNFLVSTCSDPAEVSTIDITAFSVSR